MGVKYLAIYLAAAGCLFAQADAVAIHSNSPHIPAAHSKDDTSVRHIHGIIDEAETKGATTTLFHATATPHSIHRGTVNTVMTYKERNRVSAANLMRTVEVSETLNPLTYTAPIADFQLNSEYFPLAHGAAAATPTEAIKAAAPSPSKSDKKHSKRDDKKDDKKDKKDKKKDKKDDKKKDKKDDKKKNKKDDKKDAKKDEKKDAKKDDKKGDIKEAKKDDGKPKAIPFAGYYDNTNIFDAISVSEPPSVFPRSDLKVDLPRSILTKDPIHTNKFYTNLLLGDQGAPAYAQPYTMWWTKGEKYIGLAISHTTSQQRVDGPDSKQDPVRYYINPVGLVSLAFGANEFTNSNMILGVDDMDTFSAKASIVCGRGEIEFPLVHGMGFVTAKYNGQLTPKITSQIGILTLTQAPNLSSNVQKYVVTLFNQVSWLMYVTVPNNSKFQFSVQDGAIVSNSKEQVTIQLAHAPSGSEPIYDQAAGMWATKGVLSGKITSSNTASYAIKWQTEGNSIGGTSIMMAFPHHLESFTGAMESKKTSVLLDSTTKGVMRGYLTNEFDFVETLNRDIQFLPWSGASAFGNGLSYDVPSLRLMAKVANKEIKEDFNSQTNLDSTYFSGKGVDKFAYILLVISDILKNPDVTKETLGRLQAAFTVFTSNKQQNPLMYDTKLKGITSTAAQGGNTGADFGSPLYNDHHFHYGYFIHAAAIVAYIDKKNGGNWGEQNKDWVNSLVRDVANPSSDDKFFPVFRSFDWYSGHSWAKGMFASSDGKDEESTSEDYNFAYGMKLWGRAIGDASMEARGDLMIAVMKRSMRNYFYMEDNNLIQPANFIKNKVPGITFENKLDHVTYFGDNLEYIQGIHMIPITPVSSFLRSPDFVQQEWNQLLTSLVPKLDSGWLGLLRLNQALYDPVSSYKFFAQDNFKNQWLDGGVSRTWCLAFSAGVGGSQAPK